MFLRDQKVSEYDQEIPKSHTADQPTAPPSQNNNKFFLAIFVEIHPVIISIKLFLDSEKIFKIFVIAISHARGGYVFDVSNFFQLFCRGSPGDHFC